MGNTDLTKSQDKSQCALKPKKNATFWVLFGGVFFCALCAVFFAASKFFITEKACPWGMSREWIYQL